MFVYHIIKLPFVSLSKFYVRFISLIDLSHSESAPISEGPNFYKTQWLFQATEAVT
jgi:hypothetical protein